MKLSKTKHFVYVTMLAAMAIAINLLETMLTVSLPFGMRLGLANIIAPVSYTHLDVYKRQDKYGRILPNEEVTFLVVHIARIARSQA